MKSIIRTGLSALTMAVCLSGTAFAAGANDFAGTFIFDGTPAQKAAVKAEVERAAQEFNPITRLIAKGRLERAASVYNRLVFTATGDQLGIKKDSMAVRATKLDGSPITFTHDGKQTTMTRSLSGTTIVETSKTDDGSRTMTFKLVGDELTVTTVVAPKALKEPLRYTATYHRTGK